MIDDAVFADLESRGTVVSVAVASSLDGMVANLLLLPSFRTVLAEPASEALGRSLTERIARLVNTPFDQEYANPFDVALAAYLLALRLRFPQSQRLRESLADVEGARNSWWAAAVARRLRHAVRSSTANAGPVTGGGYRALLHPHVSAGAVEGAGFTQIVRRLGRTSVVRHELHTGVDVNYPKSVANAGDVPAVQVR